MEAQTITPGSTTDLSGLSEFQRRVLRECTRIPRGETVTYGELARRIDRPGAARAVAQALAHNPYPITIPCHRVVAKNGLGGYSGPGGIEKKKKLLKKEGAL